MLWHQLKSSCLMCLYFPLINFCEQFFLFIIYHVTAILLVLVSFFSLMFVIISLAPNSDPKSDLKSDLKLAFIMLTVFIVSTFILYSNTDRVNTIRNSVINNKEYQLNLKGSILELKSSTPYIESKTFKVIYQDNKRIQVEYKDNYFDIDKSQEKINDAN